MSADLDALVALLPFAGHLGLVLDEADADRVVARLDWAPHLCTSGGVLHGGVLMSLADTAGALVPGGGRWRRRGLAAVFQAAGQELGQVGAADVGELVELGAAGEPVGQHHRVPGVAHGGQQGGLGDGP